MASFLARRLIIFAVLNFTPATQGLQFSIHTTFDSVICGRLQCLADKSSDNRIFTIFGLSIYDVTKSNTPVKMASLTTLDQHLDVNQVMADVVNATGTISKLHAELNLYLNDVSYCLNGYYLCELNFVNTTGDFLTIRETRSVDRNGSCYETEKELLEQKQINAALTAELSRLQDLLNSSIVTPKANCTRNEPHRSPREKILLWGKVPALCDTETDGGGWVVIQRRTKGDVHFYRSWDDYKNGFGNPDTDFWIGNDVIHTLNALGYSELRVDLILQGKPYFAHYSGFTVAEGRLNYRIYVYDYDGTAGDAMSYYQGQQFSTYDSDNDMYSTNCADRYREGWWFKDCVVDNSANLNGMWGINNATGVWWSMMLPYGHSLTFSEMKIRMV